MTLIEAYATAKASGNTYLVSMMVKQVEMAIDAIYDERRDQEGE